MAIPSVCSCFFSCSLLKSIFVIVAALLTASLNVGKSLEYLKFDKILRSSIEPFLKEVQKILKVQKQTMTNK
ncbi:MAG: hypothetical protein MJ247_06160 [Alphaproteobacteria bacterium]|nr:hypothetical protein [Alphaproteobacteria bacterium]